MLNKRRISLFLVVLGTILSSIKNLNQKETVKE